MNEKEYEGRQSEIRIFGTIARMRSMKQSCIVKVRGSDAMTILAAVSKGGICGMNEKEYEGRQSEIRIFGTIARMRSMKQSCIVKVRKRQWEGKCNDDYNVKRKDTPGSR